MNGKKNNGISDLHLLYQSAINLSNHEGDLIWSRFSAFIVIHTIFFALIGFLLESTSKNRELFVLTISVAGFILVCLWLLSTIRGFKAIDYWNYCAREIEERLLGKDATINLFIRGEKYFKLNREVRFNFGKEEEGTFLQRGCFTRCIPLSTKWTAYLSIGLILVLYLIIFFLPVFGLLPAKTT